MRTLVPQESEFDVEDLPFGEDRSIHLIDLLADHRYLILVTGREVIFYFRTIRGVRVNPVADCHHLMT